MNIKITLENEKGKSFSGNIESDVLSHIFVTHSLALHSWNKISKETAIKEISETTSCSDRDIALNKIHNLFDDYESTNRRRRQANLIEEGFKHLMQDYN